MNAKKYAMGAGIAFAIIVAIAIARLLMFDEVDRRYNSMAVTIEDQCIQYISDVSKCDEYQRCFRSGVEDAYPKGAMREYAFEQRDPPPEIEESWKTLLTQCAGDAGFQLE